MTKTVSPLPSADQHQRAAGHLPDAEAVHQRGGERRGQAVEDQVDADRDRQQGPRDQPNSSCSGTISTPGADRNPGRADQRDEGRRRRRSRRGGCGDACGCLARRQRSGRRGVGRRGIGSARCQMARVDRRGSRCGGRLVLVTKCALPGLGSASGAGVLQASRVSSLQASQLGRRIFTCHFAPIGRRRPARSRARST